MQINKIVLGKKFQATNKLIITMEIFKTRFILFLKWDFQ